MKIIILTVAFLGLSSSAIASDKTIAEGEPKDLDLSFVQIGGKDLILDVGGSESQFSRYSLAGSFEFGNNYFIQGDYSSVSGDLLGAGLDGKRLSVGFGKAWQMQPDSYLGASITYIDRRLDVLELPFADDSGIGITLDGYTVINKSTVSFAKLSYSSLAESGFGFTFGLRSKFTDKLGFGFAYESTEYAGNIANGLKLSLYYDL